MIIQRKELHKAAFLLVAIGAINWGLVGIFRFNLVTALLGTWPMMVNIVYILVGLSGIYLVATHKSDCTICSMTVKK